MISGFSFVKIYPDKSGSMDGWINLFFNGKIVALVSDPYLAKEIKESTPEWTNWKNDCDITK